MMLMSESVLPMFSSKSLMVSCRQIFIFKVLFFLFTPPAVAYGSSQARCQIRAVGYQNRQTEQWNRIENLEINPDTYGQLIFDKGGKNIKWEKESIQQALLGNLDSCMQSNEPRTHPHTMHENELKRLNTQI